MEARVTLDGILLTCEQQSTKASSGADCENARIAVERLAAQNVDPTVEKKRQEEFERAREQLRLTQDRERQAQEAKKKVDAYTLPVVPVERARAPAQTSEPPAGGGPQAHAAPSALPATAGTTTP
jgi:hypothetical protein